jgi:hypothetical protein
MDKEKDPMSRIMDLMKVSAFSNFHRLIDEVMWCSDDCYMDSHLHNMYEGDEDMKHTASDRGFTTLS